MYVCFMAHLHNSRESLVWVREWRKEFHSAWTTKKNIPTEEREKQRGKRKNTMDGLLWCSKSSRSLRIEFLFSFGPQRETIIPTFNFQFIPNKYGQLWPWWRLSRMNRIGFMDGRQLLFMDSPSHATREQSAPKTQKYCAHHIWTTMSNKSLPIVSLHHLLFFGGVQQIRCRLCSQ